MKWNYQQVETAKAEAQRLGQAQGTAAERDRLRKEVEGLVGFWDNHPSKRLDGPERRLVNEIFDEVLALLDKPGEVSRVERLRTRLRSRSPKAALEERT